MSDFKLSAKELARLKQRNALHKKYEEAVTLYAETHLPLKEIAARCGFSAGALKCYLHRHWIELVWRRHQLPSDGYRSIQKLNAPISEKYQAAVAACDSMHYIDFNVSQIARKFNLDGTALANFMRVHHEDIPIRREEIRRKLGLSDNCHHGVRKACAEKYAAAVTLYRTTDMTVGQVAEACHVSLGGFSQHLRFYHKEVLQQKMELRRQAQAEPQKTRGTRIGNGRCYAPLPQTEQKYAEALALYRDTSLTLKEIVRRTGVPQEGFRAYLHKWHRELVLEHSGINSTAPSINMRKAQRRMKAVATKYAAAIDRLRACRSPLTHIAAEFGLHPETFRQYLHKHEPELVQKLGKK